MQAESLLYENDDLQASERRDPRKPIVSAVPANASPGAQENLAEPPRLDMLKTGNEDTPVLLRPVPTLTPQYTFVALQVYEGTVTSLDDAGFVGRLRDQVVPTEPMQEATIGYDNLSHSDREMVVPGAVFYWAIGYRVERHGQRMLSSTIRFRRLPAWSRTDLSRLQATSEGLSAFFDDQST